MSMTGSNPTIEVLRGPERRRRWTKAQKLAMVEETYAPDVRVHRRSNPTLIVPDHSGAQQTEVRAAVQN